MHLDHDRCATIVRSKDPRFDGWFVTAVHSTGIYCRPSCPALTPKVHRMSFYPSAAAAQQAGYRACKRCLPDATPGSPRWHHRGDLVARALRLIADGVVDREGVGGLADRLGYSTRQLERLMNAEVGAGPLALSRAQRAQNARILIERSELPMAQIAHAAGFASIRSFNETIRGVYAATPTQLRERGTTRRETPAHHTAYPTSGPGPGTNHPTVSLRLPFRAPLHTPSLFGHLVATAVPGAEQWVSGVFVRSIALPHGPGLVHIRPPAIGEAHLFLSLTLSDLADLSAAVHRVRRLLDLDADPIAIDHHLAEDPALAPLVSRTAGVRIPGSTDPGEMALRAVLGQQVSTAAAATLAGRLTRALGQALPEGLCLPGGPTHLFPSAQAIAGAREDDLPAMPTRRRTTLRMLAQELAQGSLRLDPGISWSEARARLQQIPGIGPWTTEIIAMRALGDPDALPATDLGLRWAARAVGIGEPQQTLVKHAQRWRPWSSYAAALLWASSSHPVAHLPPSTPEDR